MSDKANTTVKPLILSVLTAALALMLSNWNDAWFDTESKADAAASQTSVHNLEKQLYALPSKDWMRTQFATKDDIRDFRYRIERNEKELSTQDGRQRRNTANINRLCQIADIVCSSQNALYDRRQPWPWPRPQPPFVASALAPTTDRRVIRTDPAL